MEKVNKKREKGFNYYEGLLNLVFLMDRWEYEKEPMGWGEASSRCWHLLDSQDLWASVEDFTLPVAFWLLPSLPFLLFMKLCIWLQRWYSIVNVIGFPPRSLWISSYHFCAPSPFLVSVLTLGTYNSPSEDFPGGVGCPLAREHSEPDCSSLPSGTALDKWLTGARVWKAQLPCSEV